MNRSPRSQHTIHTGSPVPTRHHPRQPEFYGVPGGPWLYITNPPRLWVHGGPPTNRTRAAGQTAHAEGR